MPKLSSIFCLMPQHSTPIMLEMFKEERLGSSMLRGLSVCCH